MTRIMLTADTVGGVWRYSLDLARGMIAEGIEPVLVLLGPPPSARQAAEARAILGLQTIPTSLPLDWTARNPAELRSAAAALAGLAIRLRVDSVHLHTPALAAQAPWSVPVVAVAHSCVKTWWKAVRGGALPDDLAWRAEFMAQGLAEADIVIAPTQAFAADLMDAYHPERAIEVVHNGRAPMPRADVPRGRGVMTAGRLWDDGKNVGALDRAASRLDCEVVGAGPLAGPNLARVAFNHLRAPGPLSEADLAREMASKTVYCAPARYEPFGLAILEAAQAGMALTLADIPSFRELWDGAALFFHPDDDGGLRDALLRALDMPDHMAALARERAAAFTVDSMVAATVGLHGPMSYTPGEFA